MCDEEVKDMRCGRLRMRWTDSFSELLKAKGVSD